MWKARLEEVNYDFTKTNERFEMVVRFFHTDTRTYMKTYIIQLDELPDVSLATFKSYVDIDLARINKLETILTNLSTKIGREF